MRRAVLFDYGLTLVGFTYPRPALLEFLDWLRPRLGAGAPDSETLMRTVLEPLEADLEAIGQDEVQYLELYGRAWRRAGLDPAPDLLLEMLDREQRCWDAAVRPAPGALSTLDRLRKRGLRVGLASNAPFPRAMMLRQLGRVGLAARLDSAVFSSEVGRRKPAAELYLAGLERLGATAAETLYVGDRVVEDYEGPLRVGMEAVICTALARAAPPPGVPVIGSLPELLD